MKTSLFTIALLLAVADARGGRGGGGYGGSSYGGRNGGSSYGGSSYGGGRNGGTSYGGGRNGGTSAATQEKTVEEFPDVGEEGDDEWIDVTLLRGATFRFDANDKKGFAQDMLTGATGESTSTRACGPPDTALLSEEGQFAHYAAQYGKQYTNMTEWKQRQHKWLETDHHIKEVNARAASSGNPDALTLAHNRYSDGELPQTGRARTPEQTQDAIRRMIPSSTARNTTTAYDWRDQMVGVKDQGACGSCYAFSGNSTLEGVIAVKSGAAPIHLSEQEIVDCSSSFGNGACNGGLELFNWAYQAQNGAAAASDYPYVSGSLSSATTCTASNYTKVATVTNYGQLYGGATDIINQLQYGPVTIGIQGENTNFYNYSGGLLDATSCPLTRIDHGVTVVGYVPATTTDDTTDGTTDDTTDNTDGTTDDTTDGTTDDTTDGTTDDTTDDTVVPDDEDETTTVVVTTCELRRGRDRRSPTGCRKTDWYPQADNRRYCCYDEEVVQLNQVSRQATTRQNEEAYFIVQNSWGTSWGESGFVRMKAEFSGNGACGINVEPFWVDGNAL